MDDTLFPADDPFEPLARLEDQLRHSRERLTDGSEGPVDPADSVPAHLAMEAEEVPEEAAFSFDLPDMPDISGFIEIPEAVEPEVVEMVAEDPSAEEAPDVFVPLTVMADDEDDVWEPFPAVVLAVVEEPVTDAEPVAVVGETTAPEQDPLVVEPRVLAARSAAPAVTDETDRAIAEAAREVSWLARRVADGLDSMTARLDGFEEQLSAIGTATATAASAAAIPPIGIQRDPSTDTDPSALEEWSMALARLVRSDSNALRDEVHRIAAEQGSAMAEVHRLTEENGMRISEAVEDTIARIDTAVMRLADSIEKRLGSAISSLQSAAEAMRSEDQEALVRMIDDRMEALARLMRSDNERISARLEAEIGIGREVLRAAKELQASLANDVATALDQRDRMFRSTGQGSR